MNSKLSLIPIDRDGSPRGYTESFSAVMAEVCRALSGLYAKVGFEEPWIGYLARAGDTLVGTCSFKSKPENRRVEIEHPEDGTVWEWHLVDGTETGRPGVLPPHPGEVRR